MKWISLVGAMALFSQASLAATIAVIDSGLDYKHEMIVPNLWTNANEVFDRRDNDGNGYQDDVHGWNFAEQNGQIIDYSYLGTFSSDPEKFFDIQGKSFLGKATEEELNWVKEKRNDKKFQSEMQKFGNFIHGTHVAGIAIRDSENEAMGIKLIPTEIKPFFKELQTYQGLKFVDRWALLEKMFDALAQQQMQMLKEIAQFVHFHKAEIANGSFGTGYSNGRMITDNAYKILFFKSPSEEDSKKAWGLFLSALLKHGESFVGAAPDTLFVFASGNEALNNDEYGTSPANISAPNVMSVGATYKNQFFAPFSNYGTKTVDVAAPGMLINSAIPGTSYMNVSGTSQAAPYVANVAGRIKDINPNLKPADIKTILMGTVDRVAFLTDKVKAGGIVNDERALWAARLSKTVSLKEAISRSRNQVRDLPAEPRENVSSIVPIPLAPTFR